MPKEYFEYSEAFDEIEDTQLRSALYRLLDFLSEHKSLIDTQSERIAELEAWQNQVLNTPTE